MQPLLKEEAIDLERLRRERGAKLSRGMAEAGIDALVTIGTMNANYRGYVLDAATHRRVPLGVVGVHWIAGLAVARGYINRPEKTAAAFRDDPFVRVLLFGEALAPGACQG